MFRELSCNTFEMYEASNLNKCYFFLTLLYKDKVYVVSNPIRQSEGGIWGIFLSERSWANYLFLFKAVYVSGNSF